jgi:hypothetical protein
MEGFSKLIAVNILSLRKVELNSILILLHFIGSSADLD